MVWEGSTFITASQMAIVMSSAVYVFLTRFSFSCRLLNANKIHCVRVNVFHDLENLSLLSLYDNKIQTLAKGTFAPLKSIQTLYEAFDV